MNNETKGTKEWKNVRSRKENITKHKTQHTTMHVQVKMKTEKHKKYVAMVNKIITIIYISQKVMRMPL